MRITDKKKYRLLSPLLPRYAIVPVALMLVANSVAYFGTRLLDIHAPLCNVATALDGRIPFVPAMISSPSALTPLAAIAEATPDAYTKFIFVKASILAALSRNLV